MGFLPQPHSIINRFVKNPFVKAVTHIQRWVIVLAFLISALAPLIWGGFHSNFSLAQALEHQSPQKVHPLPDSLATWASTETKDDYFQDIKPLPLGYLIWSDRPVSIYVGPSHFANASQSQAWKEGVQQAIADWQQYFPVEITDQANANILIEQIRPKRTSNGRVRSAQATPKVYCQSDRLTHQFIIHISPSQTSRYIQAATRHELGHALGLWGHSENPQDVMYKAQVRDPPEISERDIRTLKKVYEQPTLLGWPSPQYCSPSTEQQSDSPR